ncbi:competence/damage-inducible protein A [Haladaptatus salinisoli]|uniref:competence/damage-inducible protein A n=1 Tax=Haladaptatus salinisoli TaxID=2884876 RepID=UPI001D0AC85E|nr:molybdopterin-binding protein [Haladaptatus salinisoli]
MEVALLTVGDEILAGDTVNTNASWLAARIHERGGSVRRILTVPDDSEVIARRVRDWRAAFDAVVVTGGIGGTPDDVTMEAVANALDLTLVVSEPERERLLEKARAFETENPELAEEYDFDFDVDAAAALPAGGRPLATDAGWAPGCVVENVYVLPGVPREMRAMFDLVADEFAGDVVAETLYTPTPEGALGDVLETVRERFDVTVGSYPGRDDDPGRLKVTAENSAEVAAATEWLRDRLEVVAPVEDDSDGG